MNTEDRLHIQSLVDYAWGDEAKHVAEHISTEYGEEEADKLPGLSVSGLYTPNDDLDDYARILEECDLTDHIFYRMVKAQQYLNSN